MTKSTIRDSAFTYTALSSDISSGGTITGANKAGAKVLITDNGKKFKVASDGTLIQEAQTVVVRNPVVTSDFTGQIAISGSSANVNGGNVSNINGFMLKAHPSNAVSVWFFPHSGTSASGFPLDSGEVFPFSGSNLNLLDFGVTSGSGTVCWSKL